MASSPAPRSDVSWTLSTSWPSERRASATRFGVFSSSRKRIHALVLEHVCRVGEGRPHVVLGDVELLTHNSYVIAAREERDDRLHGHTRTLDDGLAAHHL